MHERQSVRPRILVCMISLHILTKLVPQIHLEVMGPIQVLGIKCRRVMHKKNASIQLTFHEVFQQRNIMLHLLKGNIIFSIQRTCDTLIK